MSLSSAIDWLSRFAKGIMKRLTYNPFWRSVAEIFATVFFTFGPFLLLSIPFTPQAGELSNSAVQARFWEFWEGGELVLPILGLSGALVSLAALNKRALHGALNYLSWFIAIACAIGSGFVLSETDVFSRPIHPPMVLWGFVGYAGMLLFWGIASFQVHVFNLTDQVKRENPEERADNLNRQKAAAQKGGAK